MDSNSVLVYKSVQVKMKTRGVFKRLTIFRDVKLKRRVCVSQWRRVYEKTKINKFGNHCNYIIKYFIAWPSFDVYTNLYKIILAETDLML